MENIRDTTRTPETLELTDGQKQELDRRLDAYEKEPQVGSSWPEVKARLWPSNGIKPKNREAQAPGENHQPPTRQRNTAVPATRCV